MEFWQRMIVMIDLVEIKKMVHGESVFNAVFDLCRIVDEQTNRVCTWEDEIKPTEECCYCVWDRPTPCSNCVSKQAILLQKKLVKLEYTDHEIYFVISYPFKENGHWYNLEMVMNVTLSLSASNGFDDYQEDDVRDIMRKLDILSMRDSLTSLYNRTYTEQKLANELKELQDPNQTEELPLFIALLDLDDFTVINDRYGHWMGDDILLKVAGALENQAQTGWAARIAGDQFLLLLKDSEEQVLSKLKTIQEQIHAVKFSGEAGEFSVSLSIGVQKYDAQIKDHQEFLKCAHEKLSQAKAQSGKNQLKY